MQTAGLFGDLREPPKHRFGLFVQVALNKPVRREFTYGVAPEFEDAVTAGVRVAVPFGRDRSVGVVVAVTRECEVEPRQVRPIARVLDPAPVVDDDLLGLTRWLAETYACSWGEALAAILPSSMRKESSARTVLVARAAEGVGETELAELVDRFPKQHRLLRTLLDTGGEVELKELTRKLNLSESPARTLAKRGWIVVRRERERTDELMSAGAAKREVPSELTADQQAALDALLPALDSETYRPFLLQGVTGSGKTEVYLRLIERALNQGRGAIVLVPEISLTPQTVGWFRSRFGQVAVMHSRMTDAQRRDMWLTVKSGEARVVVGARSAIFAPVQRLGVIVIDEEHEPTFKQNNTPRYHARDVALERARRAGAVTVLGSATPSLETWRAGSAGEIGHLRLPSRVRGRPLPPVDIVDMRTEGRPNSPTPLFSRKLQSLLGEALGRGEQAILFLNQRGHTRVLYCPSCHTTVRCGNCDASLTFHRRIARVVCHLCCEESRPPNKCTTCTFPGLIALGAGVERVEAAVRSDFPKARVRRMDSDTMLRFEDYRDTLDAFGACEIDVLVGTQMIAKGLDFPTVTVVGVVNADSALHLPDFRSAERTHQLIAQVAGRAGRGDLAGRIVVQSSIPDHPAIIQAASHDFDAFAGDELELRRELGYPPYGRVLRAVFEDTDEERVKAAATACAESLRAGLGGTSASVLGPAPAPIALVRGRHRAHILVKCGLEDDAVERGRDLLAELAQSTSRPRMTVDVDPLSLL